MTCQHCTKKMVGRSDKRFCSIKCKNAYHREVKLHARTAVNEIDAVLHRNYAICLELMQTKKKIMVPKLTLEKMGFSFHYYTGSYLNNQNKTYFYVYDFQWMEFSTQDVLIIKSVYKKKN